MKTKPIRKFLAFLMTAVMLLTVISCGNSAKTDLGKDREGNSVKLPDKIEKIVSMGPSVTEILVALGAGDKIIAADINSKGIAGLKSDVVLFNTFELDSEKLIDLAPDLIFVPSLSKASGTYKLVEDIGICVVYLPSSTSIEAIKEDIRYIAAVMGAESKGKTIISDFEKELAAVKKIGDTITEKKTVHFECAAAPWLYVAGSETFVHEMIVLIGAVNPYAGQKDWFNITDEAVLTANPDVILTSVDYIPDPVAEIKSRPGWDAVTAVKNNAVYYIDTDSSNRPNHNIIKALKEMAKAVYPDKY